MHIDAGWGIVAGSDITGEGAIRAGGVHRQRRQRPSGRRIQPLRRTECSPRCMAFVWTCGVADAPENLLSGFWDRVACGAPA